MTATVKGLLKGLKYFTNIFDQKEPEMQISLPTDVKHVAHIGWDGPSPNANNPSWMTGFKSAPELVNQPSISLKESKNHGQNLQVTAGTQDAQSRNSAEKPKNKSKCKSSTGGDSPLDSPTRRSASDGAKQSRRSTFSNTSTNSPRGRHRSNLGIESPLNDASGVPKPSRQKKSKGYEGSSRLSKSKGQNSSPDTFLNLGSKTERGQGMNNKERKVGSRLQANEGERMR